MASDHQQPSSPTSAVLEARVLVVDDDPLVRKVMLAALADFGCHSEAAVDGREAVRTVSERPGEFDLAIVDLRMPGMDGPATIRALKQLKPDLPVLVASGNSQSDAARTGIVELVVGFIDKPFSLEGLLESVRAALNRP